MDDLFSYSAHPRGREILPLRELGAYEALWDSERASFRSLARLFREHPGALPSDFVPAAMADQYARRALQLAAASGVRGLALCVRGMPAYPLRLRDALYPVELLYYQGRWELLQRRCIAIVGTRQPSAEGEQRAATLARHFAQAGFTVLSGLAVGIDTAVHRAALEAGGLSAAVLGTPLTAQYPPENAALQERLAREFLVLSQVPMLRHARQDADANRLFFPERNATLAALAEATVVVEAGERSGALIAARHALHQGRKVFIFDEPFRDARLAWPARLEQRGAIHVHELAEIGDRLAA